MPPKQQKANANTSRSNALSTSRELSIISETSSPLTGSVASAASQISLKESKAVIRDRKIVFWTPVMIWPSGFVMRHKKETVEYRSDESLHNKNYPYLSVKLQGGVIIDLHTSAIEPQIS